MRITAAQQEAFRRQQRHRFVQRLATYLKETLPERTWRLSHQEIEAVIEGIVEEAIALKLCTEIDVARYARLKTEFGRTFDSTVQRDRDLWALLHDFEIEGRKRVDALWRVFFSLEDPVA